MYQSGQFDVPRSARRTPNIDVGVMPIPHPEGKETAAILGGWSFVVPSSAQEPRRRQDLRRLSRPSPTTRAVLTDTFPARISAMKLPSASTTRSSTCSRRCCPTAVRCRRIKNWVQITQAYFDGIQRILLGDEDVQTAMDGAAEEIEALLAD